MARLIKTDRTVTEVFPKDGKEFTVDELMEYVGGFFECVRNRDNKVMFVNEYGKIEKLPYNELATDELHPMFFGEMLVGDVLVTEEGEVS